MSGTRNPGEWKGLLTGPLLVLIVTATASAQYGTRLNGEPVARLAAPGARAVALFFVASDCPISDRTFPEMKRVREEFASRGVSVWFVYPNSTEKAPDVEKHQHAFDDRGEALLDPDGDLVRLTHARVTPEVSVLVPAEAEGWKPVYTGRIDDRFVHLGLERPKATQHFAEAAIEAVLSGRPVPRATGTPVGCGIISMAADNRISGSGAMGSMRTATAGRAVGDRTQP